MTLPRKHLSAGATTNEKGLELISYCWRVKVNGLKKYKI